MKRPESASRTVVGAVLLAGALASAPASSTESGGTARPLGVDTILSGVMPPPGLRFSTYLIRYQADETKDGAGNPRPGVSNFDLTTNALNVRLQYVWPGVKLWGADLETRLGFTAYADVDVAFDVRTPSGQVRHMSGSADGIGDTMLGPALLGWHSAAYHQIAGVLFYLPTGRFDPSDLARDGRGYYSIAPSYWFTWFPDPKVEVSGNLGYVYNFRNPDTDYQSGQEVGFDYGLGYALNDKLQIGVSGYGYKQVSDDKVNGRVVGDGNRGQVLAIGPFLRYHEGKHWGVVFKWQIEGDAKNRPQGDRFYVQFSIQLF